MIQGSNLSPFSKLFFSPGVFFYFICLIFDNYLSYLFCELSGTNNYTLPDFNYACRKNVCWIPVFSELPSNNLALNVVTHLDNYSENYLNIAINWVSHT